MRSRARVDPFRSLEEHHLLLGQSNHLDRPRLDQGALGHSVTQPALRLRAFVRTISLAPQGVEASFEVRAECRWPAPEFDDPQDGVSALRAPAGDKLPLRCALNDWRP